jgi:catechol 2,3-dioxygenase-like lactoylglutathione lyase family enzyme
MDMKLEVVVVPVSDVDRAKDFYKRLGFREDIDYVGGDGYRVVQLTPPGSACSIIFGKGSPPLGRARSTAWSWRCPTSTRPVTSSSRTASR